MDDHPSADNKKINEAKIEWLAPQVDDVQEIKRFLTKGFLNFKEENKNVREVEEKSLYPKNSPDQMTTRYLKVAA